jgi:isoleucyl-tRNA synthetase
MFTPLPDNFTYPQLEHEVLQRWDEADLFKQSLARRQASGAPMFMFYEGPPTVNGRPGIHHVLARTVKDMICRYKSQRGYYVPRIAGWDTHGLPVEIAVEKELGITNKKQIDELGVAKFNHACREFVYRNIEQNQGWRELTRRMGYWVDLDNAYITCTNSYIESVWWSLKQFFDKGLIYKDFKIVPQSPTIETPLSSHELSLGYKEVQDPNCYLKLTLTSSPVQAAEGARILVWTTTPWTLLSNVALVVGPDIDYVVVRNTRTVKSGDQKNTVEDVLVLAEARLSVLDGETEILARCKGRELHGSRYEQIFPFATIDCEQYPDALTVLTGDFVSTDDGSGVVHIAPAFGQDDFEMTKRYKLPFIQLVTPGGRFSAEAGEFAGRTVKTFTYPDRVEEGADKDLAIWLKKADKIYKYSNDYLHSYPHCWRTGNPVIYYARESWFIKSPAYKEQMIASNKTIRWQPPEIGEGRFGNWLEEVKEWSLSRDRYWGTPLPIWVSEDGDDCFAIGSIDELMEGLYEDEGTVLPVREALASGLQLDLQIDLHRPFVDKVLFRKNGKTYRRVKEVIDVWYDSGSMPFAQLHYPFENQELFEKSFPADFICEAIDQTRGWFYTLHNIANGVFGKPAFKNLIVTDLILDKDGQKMSKSKGNIVDPFDVMEEYGADAVRWYFVTSNPPWKPLRFNKADIAQTVVSDFFRSFTNTFEFFALYANIDGFTGKEPSIEISARPEIDRWILSKMTSTLRQYLSYMDEYEITKAMRLVQDFTRYDVSNWYVRRNRRRFWKGERDNDKIAAYQTLRTVLQTIAQMMAPCAPFLAETIFQRLHGEDAPSLSVHETIFTEPDASLLDEALERKMAQAQEIVFLARSLRERSKIKTRQPLKRILVPVSNPEQRRAIQSVQDIIMEEINVKAIEYVSGDTDIVKKSAKGNFKTLGKKFGKETQSVANLIKTLTTAQIRELERTRSLTLPAMQTTQNGTSASAHYTLELEDVEIINEDIEGWLVASEGSTTVALDTELTPELRAEGTAREFVSKIQNLRKESGFDVTDRIHLAVKASAAYQQALTSMQSYITQETLCTRLEFSDSLIGTDLLINDESITVHIEKLGAE